LANVAATAWAEVTAKIAMPRGSQPGERRGGRQPGTPNKKTALVNAAFDAATSNPDLSPLDFLLGVMRDASLPPDWRIKAAQSALPYVHVKPSSSDRSSGNRHAD
jgi:hypothetical protein